MGNPSFNMIDAFGLQDHRSNVEAGEGVKVLMPIWFVPGRVSASESHDACARSVPKRKHFSSKEEQDKASCAHVCSIQEVETAIQTNVFKSEACGWTSKKYACMRDGETLSQSLGRLLFEPASGTVALAATQTSTAGGKLGVCGWQEHSGVYCCANTVPVKADAKSHDSGQEEEVPENPFTGGGERIIAECPGIMSDKNFRPAPASGDEDTEGAGDEDWEKVMKMDPDATPNLNTPTLHLPSPHEHHRSDPGPGLYACFSRSNSRARNHRGCPRSSALGTFRGKHAALGSCGRDGRHQANDR